ncbi:hypothetical protein M9Y10_043113 [Tritrichomonas musculus]|uniref:Ras family protein n=1 Tax=Tritrichomonas musculus TaxID=1915356 RepID=A0ABR2JYR6_9EUKA
MSFGDQFPNFQAILLGDAKVGKSSIFNRIVNDDFDDDYLTTKSILSDTFTNPEIGGSLTIYDGSATEKYAELTPDAAIIVCSSDVNTSVSSIESKWKKFIEDKLIKVVCVVENKIDIGRDESIKGKAVEYRYRFMEVSAKNGDNIISLANKILQDCINARSSYEKRFIKAYERKYYDRYLCHKSIKNFVISMKQIGIVPFDYLIHQCKVFSIPDFLGINFDKDPKLFFEATMATGELLCNILLINDIDIIKNVSHELKELKKLDELDSKTEHFQSIIDAALYIRRIELGGTSKYSLDKFHDTFKFMTDMLLVQRLLVHSSAFRAFVEVIGYFFINSLLIQNTDKKFNLISNYLEDENSSNADEYQSKFQIYLNFVKTVIILYNDCQLPELIFNTEIINDQYDFGYPKLFCSFIDLLTSLVMTQDLAEKVFKLISERPPESVLSLYNFFRAIFSHPNDLQDENTPQRLDDIDVFGIESLLRLIAALFRQDKKYIEDISEDKRIKMFYPNDTFENYFADCLIKYILSSVPASLKAECFNCLASLQIDLWNRLLISKIFVLDENKKLKENEGIISDIKKIEEPSHYFSIPQAISNFIASLLENEEFSPPDFAIYHNFLNNIVLFNLSKWTYYNDNMKWEMLYNICKAWNNLLQRNNYLDLCEPLYRSAISEQNFISELIILTNDDLCPVECLIEVYRLFLLLSWKESEFLRKALSSSKPLTAGVVNKISRDSSNELGTTPKGVLKMLRCFTSHFLRLQIVSIELVEFIASASPIIIQILLSKIGSNSKEICDSLIKINESENIYDYQLDVYDVIKNNQKITDKLERDERNIPITLNARCFLLYNLIKLGSSSYFVRHVCGFLQHDPPKSIRETNIKEGILVQIMKKLCEENTHLKYPIFVEKAIQILLLECKHNLTINSTLDLLRSCPSRPFFITQLRFLANPISTRVAIGCFLQILALENANSAANGAGLTGNIREAFEFLMLPLKNNQQSINPWKRNILILDFIDRIENDDGTINILDGINDMTVAYLSNPSIISLMNEDQQGWLSSWIQIIFTLLEKVPKLTNQELSQKVVGTCSLIANAILVDKKVGLMNDDNHHKNLKKLFTLALEVASILFDYGHHLSRITAYSLLSTTANYIKTNDEEIQKIMQEKEQKILDSTLIDCKSEIPILRSISFAVVESLIRFASPWAFLPFLEQAIVTTEDDWRLYENSTKAGCFILSAKCKMYSKFLTTLKSNSPFSKSHVSPDCKIIINEALIVKLANEPFWNSLDKMLTNSLENEEKLQTAADLLSLFSVISMAFNDSEDLRIQLNWFIKKFQEAFNTFDNIVKTLTVHSLNLYAAFFKLLSTFPNIMDIKEIKILNRIPIIFWYFSNEEELGKDNQELFKIENRKISQQIISQLLMSGAIVLMKLSESVDTFTTPIFGGKVDKRSISMAMSSGLLLSLSVITSYLSNILKEIKDIESRDQSSSNNSDNRNDNNGSNKAKNDDNKNDINVIDGTKEALEKRSVASACLLIIWYHINRWKRGTAPTDISQIRDQVQAFNAEPYINFTGSSSLDAVILKQLTE